LTSAADGSGDGVTVVDQQPGPVIKRQCRGHRWAQFGFASREECAEFGNAGFGIATGPDGALWFTSVTQDRIGRMIPSGRFTSFVLPTYHAGPFAITSGPGKVLWFTENSAGKIGRIASRPPARRSCNRGGFAAFGFTFRAACRAFVDQVPAA
jgi:hypothetical protein